MLYVIQTLAGDEDRLLTMCRKAISFENEEAFVPMSEMIKRVKGEDVTVRAVLFPGYVFFRTENALELFFRLKKVPYLTKLLRMEEELLSLSKEEENTIEQLMKEDYVIGMSKGLIENDRIRITSGPLKDFTGEILKIDRHKKTAILGIMFLGEKRSVKVGLEIVRKA